MQKIRIRGTEIDININDEVFPFIENGILYLRIIVLDYMGEPTEFLTITPADILYRISPYDQEVMDDIHEASEQARDNQAAWIAAQDEDETTETVDSHDGMYHG